MFQAKTGPRHSETFVFEVIIFSSLWQTVSDMCSENDKIILLSHFSKVHANEGHLEIAFLNLT